MRRLLWGLTVLSLFLLSGCALTDGVHATFTATPDADFPPLEVVFDASGSSSSNGTLVSYEWDFGDGEEGAGVSATHTYTEKGVYAVTLVVTDSTGAAGARTRSVEALNHAPVASFTPSSYATAVDSPIWFDASESYDSDGEIVNYIWSFGDGMTDEGVLVEHEYTTAQGSGWKPTVTLRVVDNDGDVASTTRQILVVGCDSCG